MALPTLVLYEKCNTHVGVASRQIEHSALRLFSAHPHAVISYSTCGDALINICIVPDCSMLTI